MVMPSCCSFRIVFKKNIFIKIGHLRRLSKKFGPPGEESNKKGRLAATSLQTIRTLYNKAFYLTGALKSVYINPIWKTPLWTVLLLLLPPLELLLAILAMPILYRASTAS